MKCIVLTISCLLVAVAAYKLAYPTFSFHVRLTVVVDDHGEKKSASSVIGFSAVESPTFGGLFSGLAVHSSGEAVFLDLGNGNNLVALLGLAGFAPDDIVTITTNVFFDTPKAADYGTITYCRRIVAENLYKPRELRAPNIPTMVHFKNLKDRKTIEAVDPTQSEGTLGAEVKLLRVELEITNASVTRHVIDNKLPWLSALIGDLQMNHVPIYFPQRPEIGQERIFFTGFRRDT